MGELSPPTPPLPGAKATLLRGVGYFLLGAVSAPAICFVAAWFGLCGLHNGLTRVGLVVFFVLLAISCALFAKLTHWVFKTLSGPAPAYASGVAVTFSLWSLLAGLEGQINFMAGTIVGGFVLTVVAWVSARRGLVAYSARFRAGLGNTCAHCHYDLSATAEGAVCPECGGTLRYDKKA